jgi:hypothetical protein
VFPARDILPTPAVEGEEDDVCVGLKEDRESKGVGIKEFVLDGTDRLEKDDGVKEGEVVGGDVSTFETVYSPGIVVGDVPACGDDDISQEHDEGVLSDVVPGTQRSWNGGSKFIRDQRRWTDSELNLKRSSATSNNMTNCSRVSG